LDQTNTWIWMSLVALGFFHGLNPAMGWLFAVALGLQERRTGAVVQALGPIAAGHAAAIAVAAFITTLLGRTLPTGMLLVLTGIVLLLFSGWRLLVRFRHPRTRFRASLWDLASWSFLMATSHGASLMVAPLLVAMTPAEHLHSNHMHHMHHALALGDSLPVAVLAVVVHTAGMFIAMAVAALVVYWTAGLEILRLAWINTDLIWIAVLVMTGVIALALGLWDMR
jgi:magnesium-transporting ATPase (P-type)